MAETDSYTPSDFVVPIVGMNEDGSCGPFLGSGVFATENAFLVTCDHVLEPWKGKYAVSIQELNHLFVAEPLVRDEKHDLAVLIVPKYRPPHCVPLEEDSEITLNKIVICYEYGTTVTAGKHIEFSPANRLGNVTRIRDLQDRFKSAGDHMLELSFPALKGASGAPVMDWRPPFKLWGLVKANVGYELLPAQIESIVDTTGKLSEETKFYLPQALAVHVKHVRQLLGALSV